MDSQVAVIESFLLRELGSLRLELARYPDSEHLWRLPPGVANSGGTLALHMAGNLRHYVGGVLGGSGYVRDREREFSARGVPGGEILREIDAAELDIRETLPTLTRARLAADYPEAFGGRRLRTGEFLVQLVAHLAYHLGQLSYHRRVVTGDAEGVGAVLSASLSIARPVRDR